MKSVFTPIFLLAAIFANAQFTDVINSNRPGESMAAFSVGKTVIQAEFGIYGVDEKHQDLDYQASGFGGDLMLRYGAFFEQLELILELQYQKDNFETATSDGRNGIRQAVIGGKFLFYDPNKNYKKKPDLYSWKRNHSFSWREFIPAVGLYAGANLNIFNSPYSGLNEQKISPKLMLLTQNQFGKWVVVTNIIADKLITNYLNYGAILTVTRGINERWSAFLEAQGFKSDLSDDLTFRGGAAFLIRENIQVDASIGHNVKVTPGILTGGIGVSWRFDENYSEVLLRAPGEEKSEDEKALDKKKEKSKKRLDEIEGTPAD